MRLQNHDNDGTVNTIDWYRIPDQQDSYRRVRRGRPEQVWMDCVNRDMRAIGTTKDEVHDITGYIRGPTCL